MSGWAAAAAIAGQLANTAYANYQSNKAWKRQKQVLRNQHQWEVDDLKAAGINPILTTMSHATAPSVNTASADLDIANALAAENAQKQQANQDALTGAQLQEIQSRIKLNSASTAREVEQANLANQQAKAVPTQAELNRANAANASATAKQTEMVNQFNVKNPNVFQTAQAHKAMPNLSPGGSMAIVNEAINDAKDWFKGLLRRPGGSVVKDVGRPININSAPNNGTSSPTLTNSKLFTDYNDQ